MHNVPENWLKCKEHKLWGVRGHEETKQTYYGLDKVVQTRQGDNIVFHVVGEGVIAICKVLSDVFNSKEPIWNDGLYSWRIKISLEEVFPVPIPWKEIGENITDADTDMQMKGSYIQWKSMIKMSEGDLDRIKAIKNEYF